MKVKKKDAFTFVPHNKLIGDNRPLSKTSTITSFTILNLFEWLAPSFNIGHLAQRFAFLLTFPDGLGRVAERKDRQDRDLLGNAQQGVDLRQIVEAHPVGADAL